MKTFNSFCLLIIALALGLDACRKEPEEQPPQPPNIDPPNDYKLVHGEPAWSPDGKTIAYMAQEGIYLLDLTTRQSRLWHRGDVISHRWSPDGQWMAFSKGGNIYKRRLDSDSLIRLTTNGRNYDLDWSPDGKFIVYGNSYCGSSVDPIPENGCGLQLMTADGQYIKRVALYGSYPPAWNKLTGDIFFLRRKNTVDGVPLGDDLFAYSLTNETEQRLLSLKMEDGTWGSGYLRFSSINQLFVFESQSQFANDSKSRIWSISLQGKNLKKLTDTYGFNPDWSPDGKQIVYVNGDPDNGYLWLMNADGSQKRQLTFP